MTLFELVEEKYKWLGGRLIDHSPCGCGKPIPETTIVDILMDGMYFEVVGEKFSCGSPRKHTSITPMPRYKVPLGGLAIQGYCGQEWHIVLPQR